MDFLDWAVFFFKAVAPLILYLGLFFLCLPFVALFIIIVGDVLDKILFYLELLDKWLDKVIK